MIFIITPCDGEVNVNYAFSLIAYLMTPYLNHETSATLNSRVWTATCKYIITKLMKLMTFQ